MQLTSGRRDMICGLAAALAVGLGRRSPAWAADAEPGTVLLSAGGHWGHLTITNPGNIPVLLRPAVVVEAMSSEGNWRALETEMALVAACDPDGVVGPLPEHIAVPPGGSLSPPPWRGWSCNGQCERHCRANVYWGAGPFRFRVVVLPSGRSFTSATGGPVELRRRQVPPTL